MAIIPQSVADERVRSIKSEFPAAQVHLDRATNEVQRILDLTLAETTATTPEDFARAVLRKPSVLAALGLSADLRELCGVSSARDPQLPDSFVVRMQQCLDTHRVLGAELVMNVRLRPTLTVTSLLSSLVSGRPEAMVPTLTAGAAETVARAAFRALARGGGAGQDVGRPAASPLPSEIVVFDPRRFSLQGPPRLCWLVHEENIEFLIDARDGTVVYQYAQAHRTSPRA